MIQHINNRYIGEMSPVVGSSGMYIVRHGRFDGSRESLTRCARLDSVVADWPASRSAIRHHAGCRVSA
jgi:hypothetical protein